MSTVKKIRNTEIGYGHAIISNEVKDHSNDPFVLQKVQKAKEFLKKSGLPRTKTK